MMMAANAERDAQSSTSSSSAVGSIGRERASRQKQRAFAAFLEARQHQLLKTIVRLLRNREEALDVLQEVAMTLYTHWERLDEQQNIDGWLYRVAVNESYRWLRARKKHPLATEEQASSFGPVAHPRQEERVRTKEFQRFLSGALELLSEQERLAYVLRDLEQCSGKEMAAVMGCQPATVRGYYFSARKKLAEHIQTQAPEWLALLGKEGGSSCQ
jgi:RNA polymerase sigma-70 factor (ECF subfamily)